MGGLLRGGVQLLRGGARFGRGLDDLLGGGGGSKVQVTGRVILNPPDLPQRLRRLGNEIARQVLQEAVREEVKRWAADARRRAVRGSVPHVVSFRGGRRELVQPGNLARSISVRKLRGARDAVEARYGVIVRSRAFYWRWVELGKRGASAKPFLAPAFNVNARPGVERVSRDVGAFIARRLHHR
jgi:HK97 gp10 family phage protein